MRKKFNTEKATKEELLAEARLADQRAVNCSSGVYGAHMSMLMGSGFIGQAYADCDRDEWLRKAKWYRELAEKKG